MGLISGRSASFIVFVPRDSRTPGQRYSVTEAVGCRRARAPSLRWAVLKV